MKTRYRNRAALALIVGLTAIPVSAEAEEYTVTDETAWSVDDVAAEWDLNDVAGAQHSAVTDVRLAALPEDADSVAYGPQVSPMPPPDAARIAPVGEMPRDATGHVPREFSTHRGFFRQTGAVGTELALLSAYIGVQTVPKLFKPTTSFHFRDEGWFGKDTHNLGVDKLTHAYNTYLIAELLHYRIHRNTGGSEGDALTAGILAAGLMAINEISDAIEPDSGYSMQDVTMNVAGAAFSVLRNTVPGLKEKLAFKLEIVPNSQIYSHVGKRHYQQQRFMFSLKGAGFAALERSSLRYLDLQVGYYASDFLNSDRDRGITPKRHLFAGVGLNLGELLFAKSNSRVGRAAYSVLDYLQVPYTSLRYDTTGRLGT